MGFPDSSVSEESALMQETQAGFLGWEDQLKRDRLPNAVFFGLPCGLAGKRISL